MIGVYVAVTACVVFLMSFVVMVFLKGRDLDPKKPWVIDCDTLEQGRYLSENSKNCDNGCINVEIRPMDSNIWHTSTITNVPQEGIVDMSSPEPDRKGISSSGYKILTRGHSGKKRALDKLGISIGGRSEALEKRLKEIKLDLKKKKEELREKDEDIRTKMEDLSELDKIARRSRNQGKRFLQKD